MNRGGNAGVHPFERERALSAMTTIVRTTSRDLTRYDPARGLQEIVVAEAAERHWRRAKDVVQLMVAIEAKIRGQADYVVWRDGVVVPSRERGGPRGKR